MQLFSYTVINDSIIQLLFSYYSAMQPRERLHSYGFTSGYIARILCQYNKAIGVA